jgi:CBS domain-containing protein
MLVRDVMTHNVVTIPSNMPILEAERLLEFHKFERVFYYLSFLTSICVASGRLSPFRRPFPASIKSLNQE